MVDDWRITDAEWKAYQQIPDQGYSHRGWLDHLIAERLDMNEGRCCPYDCGHCHDGCGCPEDRNPEQ